MSRQRVVCFVCGSYGAESTLSTKPQERPSPYFPFLENHDPPKGARIPGKEGIVDCCRVCYAFLTSQWEAYERSRTPAIKRLYWLKRSDNGHFTGAEMRLQGEYIAQVMGLQYQPGVFEGGSPSGLGDGSIAHSMSPVPSQSQDNRRSVDYIAQPQPVMSGNYSSSVVNSKSTSNLHDRSHSNAHTNANIHGKNVQPVDRDQQQRSGEDDGVLDLSVASKKPDMRTSVPQDAKMDSKIFTCFVCLKQNILSNSKLINTCRQPTSEPYFPVLSHLPQAREPNAITKSGQVRSCLDCKNLLYQQWQAYEMSGIPVQHRTYKLSEELALSESQERMLNSHTVTKDNSISIERPSHHHVCYLCGHIYPEDVVQPLFTLPVRESSLPSLFFPFVRDLQRPHGAQPLKSDGSVLACRNCYRELYCQWQTQDAAAVPVYHRQYSLSFLGKKLSQAEFTSQKVAVKQEVMDHQENSKGPGSSSSSSDVSKPLNIQISESSVVGTESASQSNSESQGLLAIATAAAMSSNMDTTNPPTSTSPASWVAQNKKLSDQGVLKPNLTVPHPLQQVMIMPKKICFLCGEKCKLSKVHVLCSYPTRHETKAPNSQAIPFFPFLANRDPAQGADPMTDDGTVLSCNLCYLSLMKQWNEHEESKNPSESNRWLRKYTLPEVISCFVCSKNVKRCKLKTLSISQFPFLKEHKISVNTLVVDGGDRVAVCGNCGQGLTHQFVEYERLGLPIEMRKYNWTQADQKVDVDGSDSDKQDDDSQLLCVDENSSDSNTSSLESAVKRQIDDSAREGLGQGSKPPPLTMISPGGAKLSRNTATVPPLNQVSPSNGVTSIGANAALNATRTSSFAAALRKLAHQAKDPEEGANKHATQTGSSSTSPRAVTPKRGPPPLVYSNHSSLTSPPVVTIAPTQSHPNIVSSEGKQSLERAHSVQSTASSAYDPLNVKQERDRPQSTHSNRDEDRSSSKDVSSRRPHSGHSSTSPAANREELARGFQPYRPGEDLRHQMPPTAFGLDPAAYPYPAAFLPPHFPHPAFRFDDPVLLERYRMMQPPYLPFAHPGMLPTPGVHPFLTSGRYPAELLHQQFPFVSQASHISPALSERQRLEEERMRELEREKERERERERERDKEREAALQREKERAREREKEYEKEKEKAREVYFNYHHQQDLRSERSRERERDLSRDRSRSESGHTHLNSVEHSRLAKSDDSSGSKFGSIMHGTPRDNMYNERTEKVRPYNDTRDSDRCHRESERYDDRIVHKKDERSHNSHSAEQPLYKSTGLDKHEYEKRHVSMLYSSKHGNGEIEKSYKENGSSQSHRMDLNHKNGSKDNNFFRPFDTNILTNGFNGSRVSEYEKYSSRFKTGDSSGKSHQTGRTGIERSDLVLREESEALKKLSGGKNGDVKKEDGSLLRSTEDKSLQKYSSEKQTDHRHSEDLILNSDGRNSHYLSGKTCSDNKTTRQYSDSIYTQLSNVEHPRHMGLSSLSFPYSQHLPTVVSRLDIEEQKLREKRSKGDYCSDEESEDNVEEERKIHTLLMITNGPPLELDTSRQKMKFLRHLGLTSHRVKRELQFEKLRKRRHLHRERSVSPVELEESESQPTESSLPCPPPLESEILCKAPDFQEKCKFLGSISLGTLSPEKRKELRHIRNVYDDDRLRRLGISKSSDNSGVKRKSSDTKDGSTCSKMSLLSQGERIPGKIHHLGHSSERTNNTRTGEVATDRAVFLFSSTNKDRSLSKEFAQEFHESVLQTTRQKELNNRLGLTHCREGRTLSNHSEHGHISQSSIGSGRAGTSHRQQEGDGTSLSRWPGIEVLLEAYQHHIQEQKLERAVLLDRCHHLQVDNQDLNRTAESLSKRMAELMENKRQMLENRAKCQDTIDAMKRRVRDIR